MADLTAAGSYYPVYDNAGSGVAASKLGANNYKMIGDGASGVGPYTRFSTRKLAAIQVSTTAVDETTTPAVTQSYLQKIVNVFQGFGEVYYVGKPHATNGFVVLCSEDTLNAGGAGAGAFAGTADTSGIDASPTFESIESQIDLALGSGTATCAAVTLTGLTFA